MRHDNFDDDDRHENYFKTTSTGKTINTITKYTYN